MTSDVYRGRKTTKQKKKKKKKKMDLDLWVCFGRKKKHRLITEEIGYSNEGLISNCSHGLSHQCVYRFYFIFTIFNPIALRTAKTLWSFGHSECNRINLTV